LEFLKNKEVVESMELDVTPNEDLAQESVFVQMALLESLREHKNKGKVARSKEPSISSGKEELSSGKEEIGSGNKKKEADLENKPEKIISRPGKEKEEVDLEKNFEQIQSSLVNEEEENDNYFGKLPESERRSDKRLKDLVKKLVQETVGSQNSTVGSQNSTVGSQNSTVGSQNLTVGSQNSIVGSQNSIVGSQNSAETSAAVEVVATVGATVVSETAAKVVASAVANNHIVISYPSLIIVVVGACGVGLGLGYLFFKKSQDGVIIEWWAPSVRIKIMKTTITKIYQIFRRKK